MKCLLCSLVLLFFIKAFEISLDSFHFLQCLFMWDKISMEQNEYPMAWVTFTKDEFLALAFIGEFSISKWLGHCIAQLGVVHKLRLQDEVGRWSKMSTFCQRLCHRKRQRRGVGGQKKLKSCQRSLWTKQIWAMHLHLYL